MALTFPAEARIMASSMWLDTPGRRSTQNPFTGEVHRIDYRGAHWRGIVTIGSYGRGAPDEQHLGQRMEGFLASWVAGDEPAELPHGRPDFGDVLAASTTVSSWAGGAVTLSRDPSDHAAAGTTIRLGDRLYMSSGPTSDVAEFGVSPVLAPVLGASVSAGDTVLAMPDGDIELPFSRDFYGPWTINWVEWLA